MNLKINNVNLVVAPNAPNASRPNFKFQHMLIKVFKFFTVHEIIYENVEKLNTKLNTLQNKNIIITYVALRCGLFVGKVSLLDDVLAESFQWNIKRNILWIVMKLYGYIIFI